MTAGALVAAAAGGLAGIGLGRVLAGSGAVTLIVMQGQMVSERFTVWLFMPVMSLLVGAFPVGAGLAGLTHDPVVRGIWLAGHVRRSAPRSPGCRRILFLLTCGPGGGWREARARAFPSRHESVLVIVSG